VADDGYYLCEWRLPTAANGIMAGAHGCGVAGKSTDIPRRGNFFSGLVGRDLDS
jgi:hypothetical protein